MIDIKDDQLETLIHQAVRRAKEQNEAQLISLTNKIDDVDPIHFFNRAEAIRKNRVFWTSTDEKFYLVGVGSAYDISANKDRFAETEQHWQEIINCALTHNPYEVPGTGVLALGGFSFDPREQRTPLWEYFGDSQFTIPEFTLTVYEGNYYFTTTALIYEHDNLQDKVTQLLETKDVLLNRESVYGEGNVFTIHKQEQAVDEWLASVHLAIDEIKSGRANKIVLARELRLTFNKPAHIGDILVKLLNTQPNSYIFAFERGDNCFVGATPERLVKVEGRELLSTCLAGTAPRGKTAEEDKKIKNGLLQDKKNLEEHHYVVQMIHQHIKRYCRNIDIPSNPVVHPLKNLQHLYTPVTATLREGYTIFDIVEKLHPTPALGGVPYEKSLAFIREHEQLDRGWYGAPIGWLDSHHNGEFAVAIRSGLIQSDQASLFAGCGIMKDSDPREEYEETNIKFLPMLNVLEGNDDTH